MFQNASCLHATEPGELEAVRNLGITAPIAVIPNGVELAEFENMPERNEACKALNIDADKNYMLFLSRIHPKKGLDFLARAMAENKGRLNNWELLIAGPTDDQKYLDEITTVLSNAGIENKVHFLGMLNKIERINAYAASNLFVLPSHTENFGIVIAEAMAAGLPVITTKNTPWSEIEENNCGWWSELSDDAISNSLNIALESSPGELIQMGENGRKVIFENYPWEQQAQKMKELYEWLLSGAQRPTFVED